MLNANGGRQDHMKGMIMWLIFAVLGFILGQTSHGLSGAVLGGLVGYLLARQNRIELRLESLEEEAQSARTAATRFRPVAGQTTAEHPPVKEAVLGKPPQPGTEPSTPTVVQPVTVPAAAPREQSVDEAVPAKTVSQHPEWESPASTPPSLSIPTDWFARLLSGNILAKLGMVLLFFGIASALKLAAEYGAFPPSLRLIAASLAGLACIWAGAAPATGQPFRPHWLFRFAPISEQARTGFGFALEGGGFGILYISTYFAMAYYGYIGPTLAFLLFAGLGAACLVLAARQQSQSFALLGVLGAFLAPMLVPGQGNYLVLFVYLVLLDAFILGVSLYRAWRLLIATSFVFSVGLGMIWAQANYEPGLRNAVEGFVLALFALYSAAPWQAARRGPPGQWGWQSALLLFGPPTAAAVAQTLLYPGETGFLALSSLGAGAWYGLLYWLTRPTGDRLLTDAQAGLALAFLSLAPYLAFSRNVAGVFWALEGGGLVWFGTRAGRMLPMLAGVLLQLLSGLLMLGLWWQGPDGLPFRDSLFHASLLLIAAGALSSYATRDDPAYHRPFLIWTLLWWFAIFDLELSRTLTGPQTWVAMLGLAAATAAALEWLGSRFALDDVRAASLLLLPAMVLTVAATYVYAGHPLANGLWLIGIAAVAAHLFCLYRQERDSLDWFTAERHVIAYWLLSWALAWEVYWLASQFPALGRSLPEALRALMLATALLAVVRSGPVWPFGPHRKLFLERGLALPALLAWLWLLVVPFDLSGAWALPYVPLLNPLDAVAVLLIWSLYGHWQAAGRFGQEWGYPTLFGLAALSWLSQMLARAVHHWTGVPFLADALWHSALLQALLSLSWTAFALIVMVAASRRLVRLAWFGGLGLLLLVCLKLIVVDLANVSGILRVLSLLGVGLLVLGAGYLAPVPPKLSAEVEEG